jgi:hypothetical protein
MLTRRWTPRESKRANFFSGCISFFPLTTEAGGVFPIGGFLLEAD